MANGHAAVAESQMGSGHSVLASVIGVCLDLAAVLLDSDCLSAPLDLDLVVSRGRDVLFVYSDSPVWHDYVETQILPRLGDRAVVLNWSQRQHWRGVSLARLASYHFGGDRQFNPLAVVFRPFRRTRKFRFYQPFRDFKHGRPETLHKMEGEFFGLIG